MIVGFCFSATSDSDSYTLFIFFSFFWNTAMSLRQLSQSGLYVVLVLYLSHMIELTSYPATSLLDLTEISLKPGHVECLAGCQLQLSQDTSVECLALEQPLPGQEKMTAQLGGVHFLCRPGPETELVEDTQFVVESLGCLFSDEDSHLVIHSSCRLTYSLALSGEAGPLTPGPGADYGLRLVLAFLLVTFTFLALRDFILTRSLTAPAPPPIPLASQAVADPKEKVETAAGPDRARREERRFRQNHSAIREKSRARSRSRKR